MPLVAHDRAALEHFGEFAQLNCGNSIDWRANWPVPWIYNLSFSGRDFSMPQLSVFGVFGAEI
jgi:hypothetical protein